MPWVTSGRWPCGRDAPAYRVWRSTLVIRLKIWMLSPWEHDPRYNLERFKFLPCLWQCSGKWGDQRGYEQWIDFAAWVETRSRVATVCWFSSISMMSLRFFPLRLCEPIVFPSRCNERSLHRQVCRGWKRCDCPTGAVVLMADGLIFRASLFLLVYG